MINFKPRFTSRSTAKDADDVRFFKNLNKITLQLEGKTELNEKEMNKKSALTDQIVKNINDQLRRHKTKSLKCIEEESVKISVLPDSSMKACVLCPICSKLIRLSITKYNSSAVHNFTRHIKGSHEDPSIPKKNVSNLLSENIKKKRKDSNKKRPSSTVVISDDEIADTEKRSPSKRSRKLTQKMKESTKIKETVKKLDKVAQDIVAIDYELEIDEHASSSRLKNETAANIEIEKYVMKKINRIFERIGTKHLISRKNIEITASDDSTKIIKITCPMCKNQVVLKQSDSRVSFHNFNLHLANAHKYVELLRSMKRREAKSLADLKKKKSKNPKTIEYLYEKIVWKINQIMLRTTRDERVILADVEIIREDSDQEEDNSSNLKVEVKCPVCRRIVRLSFNSYFAISANNMRRHLMKKDRIEIAAQTKLDSYDGNKAQKSKSNSDMSIPELQVKVAERINEILERSTLEDRLTVKDIQIINQMENKINPLLLKAIVKCPVCAQKVRIQFSKFSSIATANFKRHLTSSHNVEIAEPNKFQRTQSQEEKTSNVVSPSKNQSSMKKTIIHKKPKQTKKELKRIEPKYFKCEICNSEFSTTSSFTNHTKSHTRELIEVEKTYFCDLCPSIYKSKRGLRDHIIVYHLQRRDHACDECGRCYTTSSVLREHKKNVHWKKNFLANLLDFV